MIPDRETEIPRREPESEPVDVGLIGKQSDRRRDKRRIENRAVLDEGSAEVDVHIDGELEGRRNPGIEAEMRGEQE